MAATACLPCSTAAVGERSGDNEGLGSEFNRCADNRGTTGNDDKQAPILQQLPTGAAGAFKQERHRQAIQEEIDQTPRNRAAMQQKILALWRK